MKINKWAVATALGAVGALVFAGPVAAYEYDQKTPTAKVGVHDDCEDVTVEIKGKGTNRGWRVLLDGEVALPEGADLGDIPQSDPPWELWIGPESDPFYHTFEGAGGATVEVQWYRSSTKEWGAHDVDTRYKVEKDECPTPTPTPTSTVPATEPPDEGEGGELPETGTPTTLIVTGAAVMLALGGGLYLVARRRRVTFTA